MASGQSPRSDNTRLFEVLAGLSLVALALLYRVFSAPILYADDWFYIVARFNSLDFALVEILDRRPLLGLTVGLLYRLVGLDIPFFYWTLWFSQVLVILLLYSLLRRLELSLRMAWLSTALYVVHPANVTHTWLTMLIGIGSVVAAYMYAHLHLTYAKSYRTWALVLAIAVLIPSLLISEYHVGMTVAWSLLLLVRYRAGDGRFRKSLLTPIAVVFLFSLWRTFGYRAMGIVDRHLSEIDHSVAVLAARIVKGYLLLIYAWIKPIRDLFGGVSITAATVALLVGAVASCAVGLGMSRVLRRRQGDMQSRPKAAFRGDYGRLLFVSAAFAAAAYFPVIIIIAPSIGNLASRINAFACVGAAVFMATALYGVGDLLRARSEHRRVVIVSLAIFFLTVGALRQLQVQYENRQAWEHQKRLWEGMFNLFPDFVPSTHVVLCYRGFEGKRVPVRFPASTLNMLYGKEDDELSASIMVLPRDLERLMPRGLVVGDWTVPQEQLVLLLYDREGTGLRPIENVGVLGAVEGAAWSRDYSPSSRRLPRPPPAERLSLRRLLR